MDVLTKGLSRYLGREALAKLGALTVGVAGCGGLGSNAAMMLARTGFRRFLLVDFDAVEASNLNRQQYFPDDIGMPKAEALAAHLRRLCPAIDAVALLERMTDQAADGMVARADFWLECFDAPESKRLVAERALLAGKRVFSASGMGGFGGPAMRRRDVGLLTVVGDFASDIADHPPLAPRVTQAAAMMADAVVEWVLA
jgi:sulfur carrier protein ThiS adenylyltransferase